jgi:hypothetical protein
MDDEGRATMRKIATLRGPEKGDGWLYDRTRDTWRNDWWLRLAHRITQREREQIPERDEWRVWVQRNLDAHWLSKIIAEWARVDGGKWVWKMLGSLREVGFEEHEVEALEIWEHTTGVLPELAEGEHLSQRGEQLAMTLREIEKYQAAGKAQYEAVLGKLGWCWDPNTLRGMPIPREAGEAVQMAAEASRKSHMKSASQEW